MIPPFDENGYLPPGIHPATLDEIAERFGGESEARQAQMESIRWLMDLARRAGVLRMVINGSFATDSLEPNDVDCVLLVPSDLLRDESAVAELRRGLPYLQIQLVEQVDFDWFTGFFFATDGTRIPKGMLEMIL